MPSLFSRRPTVERLHSLIRIVIMVTVSLIRAPALSADPPGRGPDSTAKGGSSDADALRGRIKSLLSAGRIDEAVRIAQAALREAPESATIRREFVDLHLSLARGWLAEERFGDAEIALDAVLRAHEGQSDAVRLKQSIESARRSVPARIAKARAWIELEWFEPAFTSFRQAVALAPANRGAWIVDYRRAAVGAGDDEYLTKNFHQAFYYYDAALELGETSGVAPDAALVSRWLQSLAHALTEDPGVRYSPSYWKVIFERISRSKYAGSDAAVLKNTIQAIAFEHAGDDDRAAQSYARAANAGSGRNASNLAASRKAAIQAVRDLYDPAATKRRGGDWRRSDTSAPVLLESERFRVFHRNAVVAQRVAAALDFHFARIADAWALDVEEIPWGQKADIHLHPDEHAFFEATGQSPPVTAISHVRLQGGAILQKKIHVHLADEMLLSASLSHELAHLMTAELRRDRPLPAVLAEGLALHAEPQCRHRQFARLFQGLKRPAPISRLLKFEDVHPTDASFYSEAHRLMAVLRTRVPLADIIELRNEATDAQRLARLCGFSDKRQLQRIYNDANPDKASR